MYCHDILREEERQAWTTWMTATKLNHSEHERWNVAGTAISLGCFSSTAILLQVHEQDYMSKLALTQQQVLPQRIDPMEYLGQKDKDIGLQCVKCKVRNVSYQMKQIRRYFPSYLLELLYHEIVNLTFCVCFGVF